MSKYHKFLLLTIALIAAAIWVVAGGPGAKEKLQLRKGLDLAGGTRVVLQARPGSLVDEKGKDLNDAEKSEKMDAVIKIIGSRVSGFQGVTEPTIQKQGTDRVIVELPGIKDPEKAVDEIRETGQLKFYSMDQVQSDGNPNGRWIRYDTSTDPKTGQEIFTFQDTLTKKIIKGDTPANQQAILKEVVNAYDPRTNPNGVKPILSGDDLKPTARGDVNQNEGGYVIAIEFTPEGATKFANYTTNHIGDILAVFLGDRIVTAPRIQVPITDGQAVITGFDSLEEAQRRAEFLNAGALPVPLDIVQQDTVQATLGTEVVNMAYLAGLIGILAVLVFMLLYYRLPGLLADVALAVYALLTFAAYIVFGVTMTLPGLAGFILSIGMAVDANVLIFERLKEELNSGKTLRAAIDAGFSRAFTAIFDSNMCTVITTIILMAYGTGMVKSFAFTLLIGVIISMFTAITVTRTLLHLLVSQEWAQKPSWFGLGTSWLHRTKLNVVGKRNWFFAASAIIIIPGIVFFVLNMQKIGTGLKPGIEFKSGSSIQATFEKPVNVTDVTRIVTNAVPGEKVEASVQISGQGADSGKTAFIRTNIVPGKDYEKNTNQIMTALQDEFGSAKNIQKSAVGSIVSAELTRNAVMSVLIASLLIVLYLSFRFAIGGVKNGFKYGMCAIIATLHDVAVIIGLFAILGYTLGWEIDTLFVTAVLTMIGFSTHDTIVVFDRVRENLKHKLKGEEFDDVANRSVNQSIARSINTSMTVLLTVIALLIFGGPTIKHFYVALLVGIVSGTYSSIFNATPLLVVWEKIANRRNGGAKKAEDKPMVGELKPMVETESAGNVVSTPKVSKPKPKKKS